MNTSTASHAMFDAPALAAGPLRAVCRGGPGLLASRWFWAGGIASCCVWSLAVWMVTRCF